MTSCNSACISRPCSNCFRMDNVILWSFVIARWSSAARGWRWCWCGCGCWWCCDCGAVGPNCGLHCAPMLIGGDDSDTAVDIFSSEWYLKLSIHNHRWHQWLAQPPVFPEHVAILTLLVLNNYFTLFLVLNMYIYTPLLHNTTSECRLLSTYT